MTSVTADAWPLRETRVDGACIRYVEAGRGEPVLLLHGYPQNHRCWRHQLADLSVTHRVVAPDWFGFGDSERRLDLLPDYDAEVERIGKLAERLDLFPLNLVGHDYGGYLGLGYAVRYHGAVRRLGILNSRAHGTFTGPWYLYYLTLCWAARRSLVRPILHALPVGALHRAGLRQYVRLGCFSPDLLNRYVAWMDTSEGRYWYFHFFAHYQTPVRPELASGLARVRCPTAIIWGDRDPYIPFSIAEELAARIDGATLTRLRAVDHFVMEQRPQEVTDALRSLLAR